MDVMFIYFHIYGYYLFICFHSLARSISISRFPKYSHYPPRGIPCSGHIDFKFYSPVSRHHGAFHSQFIRNYSSLSLTIFTSLSPSPSPSPFMCMNLDLIRIATGWILCKMKYGLNIYCSAHEQKQRYKNRRWKTFFVVVWFCFTFNTATATYTSFGILNDTLNSVLNRNIL